MIKNNVRKTFLDIFKVSLSNIIKLLSGVLVSFLLPKVIGVTDYGYYKTFTLYATYVGLLHFGFCDGIYLKYGGKNYDELDKGNFRFFSCFLILLELLISVVVSIVGIFYLENELKFIFICLSFYTLATNITNYYQIISQITGRFNEFSFRTILLSIFTAISICALWLLKNFFDYQITYRVYTTIYVLILSVLTIWYIFTYRDITFGKKKNLPKREFANLFIAGFPLMFANLSTAIILNLDRQFVNLLFDTDTYAVYAFAYNMLGLITTAMTAISTVIYPTMKKVNSATLKDMYSKLLTSILVFVGLCLVLYFPLCPFIKWYLPKYEDTSY